MCSKCPPQAERWWRHWLIAATTSSVAAGLSRHGMPPPACNDTGTAVCFPNEEEAEMRRTDDVSLRPWPLTLKLVRNVARVVEYHPANFGDRLPHNYRYAGYRDSVRLLRLFVSDLWAVVRCVRRPLDSGRGQAWSLSIERLADIRPEII